MRCWSALLPNILLPGVLIPAMVIAPLARAELSAEPIPVVEKLPAVYPATWVYAHDSNFFSLVDGKVVIVDVAAKNRNYKGSLPAGQFASFLASSKRPELYVAETVYSRRVRGERTDLLTIYDKENLTPIDEIILPGGKRGQFVTHKNTLQFLDDERLLLVFNFTPAASVLVIDIEQRRILNDIPIAGCAMIYPSGKLSFGSLCSDNTMLVTQLDKNGQVKKQARTKPFFHADDDPLFAKPAMIDGIAYYPSFKGMIQTVDMRTEEPVIGPGWALSRPAEQQQNWRPGGWQIITADEDSGRLFVLMHQDGFDGSHKNGGSEVWVYDAVTGKRIDKITLKHWGVSIQATRHDDPYLVVTNGDMNLDVYHIESGQWQRTIGGRAFETPFILHAAH